MVLLSVWILGERKKHFPATGQAAPYFIKKSILLERSLTGEGSRLEEFHWTHWLAEESRFLGATSGQTHMRSLVNSKSTLPVNCESDCLQISRKVHRRTRKYFSICLDRCFRRERVLLTSLASLVFREGYQKEPSTPYH